MDMLWSLISRHNKVFIRNKLLVFFSLLSVIIFIGLYAVFLQKLQLDAIEQFVPYSTNIKILVNEWMIAGLLSVLAVTTTVSVFGIYVNDLESKISADFLTTSTSRFKIQLSYVLSALIIGFSMSVTAFIISQLYLVLIGGSFLSFKIIAEVLAILFLSVLLSSTFNLILVLFVQTQTAYSTVSTIIGTVIGFLCGVYVPMGTLPNYVQSIIHFFPISHTTVLLREALMADTIQKVFQENKEAATLYQLEFGVVYEWNGAILSPLSSILYIICTIAIIGLVAFYFFSKKHK